jgi:hypothetical protein
LGFYLVKVMHSPFMYTYSDELLHYRNADNILRSGTLFGGNSILPVSAYYPGLESVTTAIASLTGLDIFISGLLVIGVARLVIILALYLFIEQVSGSGRVAGLAVLLYTANSNFIYWSAQFSYESLSLPLGILVLFLLAKRNISQVKSVRRGLTVAMGILIAATIVTHHVTSYALVAFLSVLSIIYSFMQVKLKRKQPNTWPLTLVTGGLTLGWLLFVASPTQKYLYQIFKYAFNSVFLLAIGKETTRALFTSATGTVAPWWERLVGISSVLLIMVGILGGLFTLWKRKRMNPFTILLAGAASLYFVSLSLRFTGAGWEVANRTSEFLFVGIAFLIAFGFVSLRLVLPKNRILPVVFTAYAAILIFGGVIAGWPPALRLSQPLLVTTSGATLRPQGLEASDWVLSTHGPDNKIIAPPSDALLLLAYGRQQSLTGKIYSIQDLLTNQHSFEWQADLLQKLQVSYLVMDRRQVSWDGMQGPYFTLLDSATTARGDFFPDGIFTMFDGQAQIPRIFDSGNIVIYDVGGLSGVTQAK